LRPPKAPAIQPRNSLTLAADSTNNSTAPDSNTMDSLTLPADWALYVTHIASEFVHSQFLHFIKGTPPPRPPPTLHIQIVDSCIHLAAVLAKAHNNPSKTFSLQNVPEITAANITAVKLDIDIVRYNEALNKEEKGTNDEREDDLLRRFPPAAQVTLDTPAVVVDNGGRYLLWYLPDGINGFFQVFHTILPRPHVH